MTTLDSLYREGWLRDVDHALGRTLLRLDPQTLASVLLAAALCSRALAFGHSRLSLAQVDELFGEIAPEREPPAMPELVSWLQQLRASAWVATPGTDATGRVHVAAGTVLVLDAEHLYLGRYWNHEQRLATAMRARALAAVLGPSTLHPETDTLLEALFPDPSDSSTNRQRHAAQHLLHSRLLILTGGPGTGKTTTVARALLLWIQAAVRAGHVAPRIALSAPTGKAAARLAEALRDSVEVAGALIAGELLSALPREASTVHRMLGWRPDSTAFRHDALHPLPFDLVVVDEASMVDLALMSKLVDAVAPDATLLLVGDRDQLPSVETGDVLAAMCDAADRGGALANHRINLQRSWRQGEEVDIPALAALVREGQGNAVIAGLEAASFRGVQWMPPRGVGSVAALTTRALPSFRAVQEAPTPADGLRRAGAFRILTAVREGNSGSAVINQSIARALQPPGPRNERFFHGALLIITENSYRHGLFNGDVGLVWRDADAAHPDALQVWFERNSDDGLGHLRAWSPAALPAHDLAFALTVHKSQGSEFDEVLLVLPPTAPGAAGNRALSRELLYTGLTRCRRSLGLAADEHALRAAIARRAQRWSGLAGRLD